MSSVLDKREKNIVTLTITVSPEDFEKAVDRAYRKNRKRYQVAGFRKGKAPRRMIERMYGEGVFFDDAINEAFPAEYEAAIEEFDLKPVAMPSMTKLDKIGYEDGLVFTIEVEVEPEFELPEYKGIEITPIEYEVKEEDIDREIERVREQNARLLSVEDTEAKSGDTVIIDFDGYVDGEQFEGGQSENYSLELGSNSFIPGFEDQLIGKKAGEDVDVNVTFPEDYHAAELAGKDSVFKVKIHEVKVKELPEVDDDFAADVSEFDTVEEYRESLSKKIKEERENALKGAAVQKIVEEICDNTEIEIPQPMLDAKAQEIKAQFEQQIIQSGVDPKTYYEILASQNGGKNQDDFDKLFVEQADHDVKQELVLQKLMEAENFDVTDEEKDVEYQEFAKAYGQSLEEFKKNMDEATENYVTDFIKQRKLFDFLIDNAKVVEPAEEETEEKAEETEE